MKLKGFNREQLRRHFGSLKMELFYYFAMITLFMVALMWAFQILLLDSTYKIVRTNQIGREARRIVAAINTDGLSDLVKQIALDHDISINIVDVEKKHFIEEGIEPISSEENRKVFEEILGDVEQLRTGESTIFYLNQEGSEVIKYENVLSLISAYYFKGDDINAMVYSTIAESIEGNPIRISIYGNIVPVSSTIEALREQLIVITLYSLLMNFIVSIFCAKSIADPISKLNDDTKVLSLGNYNIDFSTGGYTEIMELSDTLNKLAVDLENVDRMQKELIANVSHDLRTPLTMISGYGEVMRDIPGENTPENVQVIIDEANRLASIVNNLLDISKLQAGQVALKMDVINTKELLYDITSTYSKLLENKGYFIEVITDNEYYYFEADKLRLQQAMYNIINNAISHCGDDRRIIIDVSKSEENVRFEIIDHGEGIPEDKIDLIWQRYYKVEKNRTRPTAGSGLGLSIVKTIFELHNAKYGVVSRVNEGTKFWFELPIVKRTDNMD